MTNNIVLVRINYQSNLFVVGRKPFFSNIFRKNLVLKDFCFVDYLWDQNKRFVNSVLLSHPDIIKCSGDYIEIEKQNILFQLKPDIDIVDMYLNAINQYVAEEL